MRTYKKQELKRNTEKFVIAVTTVVAALLLLKNKTEISWKKQKQKRAGSKCSNFNINRKFK